MTISYWDETAKYSKEYAELWEKMVPARGRAKTFNAELIRAIGRLVYEHSNNGNCNARETEYDSVWIEEEVYNPETEEYETEGYYEERDMVIGLTSFYENYVRLIEETGIPHQLTEDLRNVIMSYASFSQYEYDVYNRVINFVIEYVLNTEDKELPTWYLDEDQ